MGKVKGLFRDDRGQGMVEYGILGAWTVVVGVVMVNKMIIPSLNDLYELIANIVFLPFP